MEGCSNAVIKLYFKNLKIQRVLMKTKNWPCSTTLSFQFILFNYLHLDNLWNENLQQYSRPEEAPQAQTGARTGPRSELSRQQETQLRGGDATQTWSLDSATRRHQTKEKYVSFSFGTWDTKSLESHMICRSYGQGSQIYFKTEALLGCIKCRRKGIPRGMVKSPVCITVRCASKKPGKL